MEWGELKEGFTVLVQIQMHSRRRCSVERRKLHRRLTPDRYATVAQVASRSVPS